MSAPRVSVILPHYRCERYLGEAIGSILGQEGVDLELLVIDDASPGSAWLEVVRAFAGDPRLRVYRTSRNVGHYRLKNAAIAGLTTPFIALQDADDASEPSRLRRQLAALERTGAHVMGCGFRYVSADGEPLEEKRMVRRCNLWLALGKRFVSLHPTTVVRREVFDVLGGYDGTARVAADDDFIRRAARIYRVRNVPEVLYRYRRRADSLTGAPETGHGSPVREAYRQGMLRREEERRRIRDRARLLASLRAPANDLDFELLPVDPGAESP
jgi:glycosyltransferase involved in cell wall biosynthesis